MARMASPMNSSMVPWYFIRMSVITSKKLLMMESTSSGGRRSLREVKPRRSDIRIVMARFSPPSSSPSGVSRMLPTTSSDR